MAQALEVPPPLASGTPAEAHAHTPSHTHRESPSLCLSRFLADCHHTCVTSPHPQCCFPEN